VGRGIFSIEVAHGSSVNCQVPLRSGDAASHGEVGLPVSGVRLCEARTGDLNYVHKRYVKADEEKAVADMAKELFFGPELKEILREFSQRSTREAHLASDADQLDMILELKEQKDLGNRYASDWLPFVRGRLLTDPGRNLARTILETDWSDWWFRRDDDWWVNADNQR